MCTDGRPRPDLFTYSRIAEPAGERERGRLVVNDDVIGLPVSSYRAVRHAIHNCTVHSVRPPSAAAALQNRMAASSKQKEGSHPPPLFLPSVAASVVFPLFSVSPLHHAGQFSFPTISPSNFRQRNEWEKGGDVGGDCSVTDGVTACPTARLPKTLRKERHCE